MVVRDEKVRVSAEDAGYSTAMAKMAAATALLRREADALNGTHIDLFDGNQNQDVDRLADTIERLGNSIDDLGTKARGSGKDIDTFSGRLGLLVQTAGALGPALAPLGAVAVGGAAALASQLGFAAVAAGTAIAAFQGVGDALTAVDKAALEPTAENLEKARLAMEQLSPAARDMVRELHGLEPVLSGLRDAAAEEMFPGLIAGMDQLVTLAPKVEGIMREIGGAIGDLFEAGAADLASPRWADFFNMLEQEARPTLESMAHSIGSVAHGLGEMWVAFAPLNRTFNGWIEDAAKGFDDWASGIAKTDGFTELVDYIRTNGPVVAHAIGAIANALLQIGEAAAPLGGPVLKGITALADAIASIADSPLGTPIMAMVTAVSALSLAAKAAAGSMRLLGLETAATSGAMGGLTGIGVVVGLQQVGSNLDKLKTSMADFREEMSRGEFNSNTFEDMTSGFLHQMPVVGSLFDGATDAVHRFGDMVGVQTRSAELFLGPILAAARGTVELADAQEKVQRTSDKLKLVVEQQRLRANELAQANHEAAQSFYSMSDAVEAPTLSLGDLEQRMREQAKAARDMAENMRKAIENGANPLAVKQMFDELGTSGTRAMQQLANGGKKAAQEFNAAWRSSQGATNSLEREIASLSDAIRHLAGMRADPKLGLNDGEFTGGIKQAGAALTGLGRQQAHPKVVLDGVGQAIAGARGVQAAINAIQGKTVTITVLHNNIGGVTSTAGGHSAPDVGADGTRVPKTGLPYADRWHYLLADGEYVVSNRYGQVDRNLSTLDAINAGRLANGGRAGDQHPLTYDPAEPFALLRRAADEAAGTMLDLANGIGGAIHKTLDLGAGIGGLNKQLKLSTSLQLAELRDRKHHLDELLKLQEKERDALKERLDALRQERESIVQGVAGIIGASADLLAGVTSTQRRGLYDWVIDPATGVGSSVLSGFETSQTEGPATYQSFVNGLTTQFGTATELKSLLKRLKALGISGPLLSWLIQNGADIDTLRDFANQDPSQIRGVNQLFGQVQQFTGQVGNQAAGVVGLNDAIRGLRADYRESRAEVRETNQHLKHLQEQMDQLKKATENVGEDVGNTLDHKATRAFQGASR